MNKVTALGLLVALAGIVSRQALAQSAAGQLGNAAVIPDSPAEAEPYGLNSQLESGAPAAFGTRHYRRGNDGGIGSSFIGTTSPTVESQPIFRYSLPAQSGLPTFPLTKQFGGPRAFSESMLYSSALTPMPDSEPVSAGPIGGNWRNYAAGGLRHLETHDLFWGRSKPGEFLEPGAAVFRGSEKSLK